MKLSIEARVPETWNRLTMSEIFRAIQDAVNAHGEGRLTAKHNATDTEPTTGIFAVGDFVPNSVPTELGAGGSKYVIDGWKCVVAGEPGTFVQCRYLTGN